MKRVKGMSNLPSMSIAGRRLCGEANTIFIAEEGQANEGDFDFAIKMAGIAADAGADGIEYQLSIADDFYVGGHRLHAVYKSREFSASQIEELIEHAHALNLIFIGTCLSERLVETVARHGGDVATLNGSDLTNPRMIRAAAESGLPFFISTLMGELEEIDWAVEEALRAGADNFGLLHGQHIMANEKGTGVPIALAQLDCISMLEKRYGLPVGFVDHTNSVHVPAIAAAKGAVLVTKHIAPQREWKGPDWQVCLHPEDWKRACRIMSCANEASGGDKTISVAELQDRKVMRRSIVAAKDLGKGSFLTIEDLAFKRPGGGTEPRYANDFIGRCLRVDVVADEMLTEDHFTNAMKG